MLFRTFKWMIQYFIYDHPEQACFVQSIAQRREEAWAVIKCTLEIGNISDTRLYLCDLEEQP